MLILLIIITVVLILALIALVVFLCRMRAEDKKKYHKLVVVRGGNVVTNGASDANELIYGEYEDVGTVITSNFNRQNLTCAIALKNMHTGMIYQTEIAGELAVGREADRPGYLHIDGDGVSRNHARFSVHMGAVYIEDLGSRNNTYLNDVQVRTPVRVENGDTIAFGIVPFLVRLDQK